MVQLDSVYIVCSNDSISLSKCKAIYHKSLTQVTTSVMKGSPYPKDIKWSCFHSHSTRCTFMSMFHPNRGGVPLFHPRGMAGVPLFHPRGSEDAPVLSNGIVRVPLFAPQYVQQLRIQRSLKAPDSRTKNHPTP